MSFHAAGQDCCSSCISHGMVALGVAGNVNETKAHPCYCRAHSAVLSTCQPALKPTYHFSLPKLQTNAAAAKAAGTGGRRLSQSLGILDGTQMTPVPIALGGRRLSQTATTPNRTHAAAACNRIAYYQSCGAAPSMLSASLQSTFRCISWCGWMLPQ